MLIMAGKNKKTRQLIIAEKPQAAAKIASALSHGKAYKQTYQKTVPYYSFKLNDKEIVVASAVGHIFGLKQKEKGSGFPIFDIEWKPSFENSKKISYTKKYYSALKSIGKDATEFVIACDYDVEGELIGFNVLRFLFNTTLAKRMKFSTLTKDDLLKQTIVSINKGGFDESNPYTIQIKIPQMNQTPTRNESSFFSCCRGLIYQAHIFTNK